MRRVLAAGTLGPMLLVEAPDGGATLVAKLITTAVGDDARALVDALAPRVAAPIGDPGLVEVVEVGVDAAGVHLLAPFVDAPTLESRLRDGRQSLSQVLEWLVGPARALAAAHEQGRLHGAVHPRDILLPRGGGVLTGLDISPALEAVGLQAPVRVPFTAPERASGKAWDARADQYSLAMLALDALSGRRLIAGTIPAFDRWTLADTPGEDARLHDVFARALHPDPAQRFSSVGEWLQALTGAAEPSSALSRFTREGVIPSAPDVRRTPPPDDVQDAKALALFPEEDAPLAEPVPAAAPPELDTTTQPSASAPLTGEWLVASMPEGAPPLADTGPLPIQSVTPADDPYPPQAPVQDLEVADADDFSLRDVNDTPPGVDLDVPTSDEPSWLADDLDEGDESSGRAWLWGAGVALVAVLLVVGVWSSLTRQDANDPGRATVNTSDAADAGAGAAFSGDSPDAPASRTGTPSVVADDALRPSAEELQPGAPAPAAPPPATTAVHAPAAPATPPAPAATANARPEPEAPLSLDRARVLIRSSPAGQVRVNGRPRGQTPLVLRDLPFGSYMIVISREGYRDAVHEIDVLPSQPVASIAVDLERQPAAGGVASVPADASTETRAGSSEGAGTRTPAATPPPTSQAPAATAGAVPTGRGSLYVVSRPTDARLFIDGQAYGTAPAVVPGLGGGSHLVRVELPGYRPWEQRVDVQPGQRVRVDATLVPESR